MAESRVVASKRVVRKRKRGLGVYMKNVLIRKVTLPFQVVGNNITENIQHELSHTIEGHCEKEGYIKPHSVRIINYSAGCIEAEYVKFVVMFECLICRPVEGMRLRVIIKNITKAGIRAETKEEQSPVVVFIARDHHFKNMNFSKLKVGDDINIRVIGIRYELNDEYISVIAEFIPVHHAKKRSVIIINPKGT